MPKPVQRGGVPIWVSGTANRLVARRLTRFGTGWIPWGPAATNVVSGISRMRELVHAEGDTLDDIRVVGRLARVKPSTGTIDLVATMERVPELAAAGVTDFLVPITVPTDPSAAFELYAATVDEFQRAAPQV
jgi:hypothetical protein